MTTAYEQTLAELAEARGDAAQVRRELRDAQTRLATMRTAEQFDADMAPLREREAELQRRIDMHRVADRFGLAVEVIDLLRGNDTAEIEANTAKLVQHLPARRTTDD